MVRAAEEPHWRTRNPKGGLADFLVMAVACRGHDGRQRPARGRGLCAWSNSSSLTLSWGAVGCGTSGTCVAGAATARTADGAFLGSCRRGLVEFCLHAGVACPALIGRHARQSWPLCKGTDDEEPPAAASLAPATGPDGRALDSDLRESAAAPLWGLSQESAAEPPWDRIRESAAAPPWGLSREPTVLI